MSLDGDRTPAGVALSKEEEKALARPAVADEDSGAGSTIDRTSDGGRHTAITAGEAYGASNSQRDVASILGQQQSPSGPISDRSKRR